MKIIITHDRKIPQRKKIFADRGKEYQRVVKEFEGNVDAIESAINYCFSVDSGTPYFTIETSRIGEKKEQIGFNTLVMMLKHSAKIQGQQKAHEELNFKKSKEALKKAITHRVNSNMEFFLDNVKSQVIEAINKELESFEVE